MKKNTLKEANAHMADDPILAAELYTQLLPLDEAALNLAVICYNAGRFEEARELLKVVDTLEADAARAAIHSRLGMDEEAFRSLERVYKASASNWEQYGTALVSKKRYKEASEVFHKAGTLESHLHLASVYIMMSELDKARSLLKAILKDSPNLPTTLLELVALSTCSEDNMDNTIGELERFTNSCAVSSAQESGLYQALGKVHEQLGNVDASFEAYEKHARMEAAKHDMSHPVGPRLQQIADKYTKEFLQRVPKEESDSPFIFIVGMPRSGTTLIEQTLVSHPDIETSGETNNVSDFIQAISEGASIGSPEDAERFFRDVVRKEPVGSRFVIDKMCGNFMFIGLMYQMFPNAKFIVADRDALDNCWSCYTTPFTTGHAYSYDFRNLAETYNEYKAYIRLWEEVLPSGTILTVSYEDMVADHEKTSREILEYIGLEWAPECADFYKVKRNVQTASLAQVVKPIYKSSLKRSHKYVKHLGVLIKELNYELSASCCVYPD